MSIYNPLIRASLLFITCLLTWTSQAQEQIGLRLENYAGVGSIVLNPTWQTTNPLNWDLNLVEAGVFLNNNYAYIENSNLFHTINKAENLVLFDDESPRQADDLILNYYPSNNRKKYASSLVEVMGPSLSLRIRDYNHIGFFIKARTAVSSQRIPSALEYDNLVARADGELVDVEQSQLATMAWSEVGINYARKIETYSGHITLGANLKLLTGYEAAYAKNNTTFKAAQQSGDTLFVNAPNIAFGFTNTNIEGEDFQRSRNGNGFGMDIGATYVYEGNEDNYKFKLGASIIDLGNINFSRNTGDYLLRYDSTQQFAGDDYNGFDNIDSLLTQASINVYNNPDELRRGNSFKMGLPTAFSLQADYMIMEMFYVSGLLVQALPTSKIRVQRGNLLALAPRFEHRWLAASLPITLYNYQHLDIGASLRIAFLTLGTDNIGSLLGKSSKFSSTDFYVALKINPFDLGLNLGGGDGGRGGNVKCYSF